MGGVISADVVHVIFRAWFQYMRSSIEVYLYSCVVIFRTEALTG